MKNSVVDLFKTKAKQRTNSLSLSSGPGKETRNYYCHESIKVVPYLDGTLDPSKSLDYRAHLKDCPLCQRTHVRALKGMKAITEAIPQTKLASEDFESIKAELAEALKLMHLQNERSAQVRFNKSFTFVTMALNGLKEAMTSKDMIKYYLLATVVGVVLKVITH